MSGRPKHLRLSLVQLLEVIQQQRNAAGASGGRVEQIAGEHQKVDIFRHRGIEHGRCGFERRGRQSVAQVRRQQIEIARRVLEMKVARVNKSKRFAGHGSLLIYQRQGGQLR